MLDFMMVATRHTKTGVEIYPVFKAQKSNDLMIRGGDFYAIWDERKKMWSLEEDTVIKLVDEELKAYYNNHRDQLGDNINVKYMWNCDSGSIDKWHKYCQKQMKDNYSTLDEELIFSNTELTRDKYASKRLNYPLEAGSIDAYDKLISTLYSPEERHKIEWAIGSIITGDSKTIQKFMVLYGAAGTGKSTILNIIQKLFEGYYCVFDAKALGSNNSSFALEQFRSNPLVAIQHDGDLSRIEDNTKLNSLVSHEEMTVNEKFKSQYVNRFKAFLFLGTNRPVKITDGKSGLLRRLIDVTPSGNKVSPSEYKRLTKQIDFELGAIAWHCREVYLEDPGCYDDYTPTAMMEASNDFYNFVVDSYRVFKKEDGTTAKAAWEMYKQYCEDSKIPYPYTRRLFIEELKNYFWDYDEKVIDENGGSISKYFSGFRTDKIETQKKPAVEVSKKDSDVGWLEFKESESVLDRELAECPAQYANENETPSGSWDRCKTKLKDLDTSKLHYLRAPETHIFIDFDLKDSEGNKSFERNLEAANKWPRTYAELSKGGQGIHLHYIYTGDPNELSRIYAEDIEVKTCLGKSSIRRRLSKCNDLPIATISSGLPLKEADKVINFDGFKSENALRAMIKRNLNKEIHASTKCSVDFIYKNLEDAYNCGLKYDVTDMRNAVYAFAAGSTNQADYCLKLVGKMKWKSEECGEPADDVEAPIVFYDCEVFPNLFVVCWMKDADNAPVVRMINPGPTDIEQLTHFRLIDFNGRNYDRHILYARMLGYNNIQLYNLSQKIINAPKGMKDSGKFGEAYNLGYTDVYDFAAKKQSLKKWEIELNLKHHELGLPWDAEVPEELWDTVAEYCCDDVIATRAVFHHLKGDFTARQILADLAGMTVNDTTNSLTTRIIFGKEKHPKLVYTDLATGEQFYQDTETKMETNKINSFPGYELVLGEDNQLHNMYRGVDMGFGGYIYGEEGIYTNIALLDSASHHPSSIISMNAFGEYTKNFKDILDARIAIKHGDYDKAREMMNGRLSKYLDDKSTAKDLAQALKIAINSVYGLSSAKFDNPFRDSRNKNNFVALKGGLFMKTLQDEVAARGFTVISVRTDSIKIADATPEIIKFVQDFAIPYGYTMEHECTYERMCLVNKSAYIARYATPEQCEKLYGYVPKENEEDGGKWTATAKQFQVPYVFKTLFSKEKIEFKDLCETFEVSKGGALYLDMNESLPDVAAYEKELEKAEDKYKQGKLSDTTFESICEDLNKKIEEGHDYRFVGKVGQFTPVKPGKGGGLLMRGKDGKYAAAQGSTGYRFLESDMVNVDGNRESVDMRYYNKLVDDAVDAINKYGDFERFVSDDPYITEPKMPDFMNIPEDANEEEGLPWD